uniref:Uncharacterized protein n=1 Tax=Arcella intermedia TaxID=1963864 RepID=A0A6B2L3L3_9EUKA|eukprot:TRINITY_DN4238_c0_g1_i1.p1 TRINITY_DN4238_c0_g1~~TRINITY_DN4238_c0_g1_i1.p1  ORF type:complete len:474 (+),score=93.45 TRINITY_DN4238_c0_g1_i1:43-1422(+)
MESSSSFDSLAPLIPNNGPARIPPQLRAMRHFVDIQARNLKVLGNNSLMHSYFSLHAILEAAQTQEAPTEEPFYVSEIVYFCNNPHWCALPNSLPEYEKFYLVIWDCSSHPLQVVQKITVVLKDLKYIESDSFSFPENTILFKLVDGLYTFKETRNDLIATNQMQKQSIKQQNQQLLPATKLSMTRKDFLSILEKKKELLGKQEQQKMIFYDLEQKLQRKKEYFELIKKRDEMRDQVKQLRQDYQRTKEIIESEGAVVNQNSEKLLPVANEIKQNIQNNTQQQQILSKLQPLCAEKSKEYEKIMFNIKVDVLELIHQLRNIYPIARQATKDPLTICGLPLPSTDYSNHDEELIAVALGHVCHAVFLLSKYLDVPLRYQMIYRCSRSAIIMDEVSHKGQYPLYSKGVDKTRFDYAVFLLNKNLEQLSNSQKLDAKSKDTLPNLLQLFDHLEAQLAQMKTT